MKTYVKAIGVTGMVITAFIAGGFTEEKFHFIGNTKNKVKSKLEEARNMFSQQEKKDEDFEETK